MGAWMIYVVGDNNRVDQLGQYDQLAAIVPSNMPTGTGTLVAVVGNQTSAPVPITIVAGAFGIFSINQGGTGPGVFTDPNYAVSTMLNSAHPGEQFFIWGTGLGPSAAVIRRRRRWAI